MTQIAINTDDQDTVTIIAGSMADAMRAAQSKGLATQGYSLQGRVVTHRFAMAEADGETDMFDGTPMIAATWVRSGPAAGGAAAGAPAAGMLAAGGVPAGIPLAPRTTRMAPEDDMAMMVHATA